MKRQINDTLRLTRTPASNTGLAKVAAECSANTFVVNQTFVLRINICGENSAHRKSAKRWQQYLNASKI